METMNPMYEEKQWQGLGVAQNVLDAGLASHTRLEKVVDEKRMAYIAGCNQVTQVDVKDWRRSTRRRGYPNRSKATAPCRTGSASWTKMEEKALSHLLRRMRARRLA